MNKKKLTYTNTLTILMIGINKMVNDAAVESVESLCRDHGIDVKVNPQGGIKIIVPVGMPAAEWMAVAEDWRNRGHLGAIWSVDGDGQTAWVGQITRRQDGIVLG